MRPLSGWLESCFKFHEGMNLNNQMRIMDVRAWLLQLGVTLIAYVYLGCPALTTLPWPGT